MDFEATNLFLCHFSVILFNLFIDKTLISQVVRRDLSSLSEKNSWSEFNSLTLSLSSVNLIIYDIL